MDFDSKLLPVLREGIQIIKMIFYKELRSYIEEKYDSHDPGYQGKLTGAILNEVFGTPNTSEPYASFNSNNSDLINMELGCIAEKFDSLRIPLTDALRVQFLCDSQEGVENETILVNAKKLGILLEERQVPLPKSFMELCRKLGVGYHILTPDSLDIGSKEK